MREKYVLRKRSLLSLMLALLLIFNVAFADRPVMTGTNINGNDYHNGENYYGYPYWDDVDYTYIYETEDGYVVFTGSDTDGYLAEIYDKQLNYVSYVMLETELPLFGGFYATDDWYFVLSGQTNKAQSDNTEVLRVTKYDHSWQRLDSVSLYGENTTVPFDAGSSDCVSKGDYLVWHTCHEMYQMNGINHQSNLTFEVRMSDMTVTAKRTEVSNNAFGYVSHSFSQHAALDNGKLVTFDHGDAGNTRSLCLMVYGTDITLGDYGVPTKTIGVISIAPALYTEGSKNYNITNATCGDLMVSSGSYLLAGTSSPQVSLDNERTRNIFLTAVPKSQANGTTVFSSTSTSSFKWLTSYAEGEDTPTNPYLVDMGSNKYMIIWSLGDTLYYRPFSVSGSVITLGTEYTASGALSDCHPIMSSDGTRILWQTRTGGKNIFYSIDTTSYACSKVVDSTGDFSFTKNADGTYTVSGYLGDSTEVEIPGTYLGQPVTALAAKLFMNNDDIVKVTIPEGITEIPELCFYHCDSLSEVILPDSIKVIADRAFDFSSAEKIINMPADLESIGYRAFYNCGLKESLVLPDKLKSIGELAFYYNDIRELYIPASLETIGEQAFLANSYLHTISVDPGSTHFIVLQGCLYDYDLIRLYICERPPSNQLSSFRNPIVVPDTVETIDPFAFNYCWDIKYIFLPDGLKTIGQSAFSGCQYLQNISIPATVEEIGVSAFSGTYRATSIVIPKEIESIPDSAFANCGNSVSETNIYYTGSAAEWSNMSFGSSNQILSGTDALVNYNFVPVEQIETEAEVQLEPGGNAKLSSLVLPENAGISEIIFVSNNRDVATVTQNQVNGWLVGECDVYAVALYGTARAKCHVKVSEPSVDPVITLQPESVTAEPGETVYFNVAAEGEELSYQWQASTDGGVTWKNSGLAGNMTDTLKVSVTAGRNGYEFRCVISNPEGGLSVSDAAKLSLPELYLSVKPADVTIKEGKTAVFTAQAKSSVGSGLRYQWQASTDNGETWKNSGLAGNKTSKLKVVANSARDGYMFRCVITDDEERTIITEGVQLTVYQPVISIHAQSVSQTITAGQNVSLSVNAESLLGENLSYRWETSKDKGTTWVKSSLGGNTTNVLKFAVTEYRNGYVFRCVISDESGNTEISENIELKVKQAEESPIRFTSLDGSKKADAGIDTGFVVIAKSTAGSVTYQWQVSTDGGENWNNSSLTGNKSKKLYVKATKGRDGYMFRCVITDILGNTLTGDEVTLKVE